MHVYLWYTNVSVSSTSTTGALDDFDKTSIPPEAPTAPDAGTTDEKVINTFLRFYSNSSSTFTVSLFHDCCRLNCIFSSVHFILSPLCWKTVSSLRLSLMVRWPIKHARSGRKPWLSQRKKNLTFYNIFISCLRQQVKQVSNLKWSTVG